MDRVRNISQQEVSEGERGPTNHVSYLQIYNSREAMEVDRMYLRDMLRLLLLIISSRHPKATHLFWVSSNSF